MKKASELDDNGFYKIRIDNFLNRVKLKALLYQVPGRAEDHAAMIIEQVCLLKLYFFFNFFVLHRLYNTLLDTFPIIY